MQYYSPKICFLHEAEKGSYTVLMQPKPSDFFFRLKQALPARTTGRRRQECSWQVFPKVPVWAQLLPDLDLSELHCNKPQCTTCSYTMLLSKSHKTTVWLMPEPLKGFWLQSLFPLTRDVLLDWAKDQYHLYPNPTACPVSNDILWSCSFFSVCLLVMQ